jgi:large subunit ribosomal protein L6
VVIPKGVTVKVEGNTVMVRGPKGELMKPFHKDMTVSVEGDQITVARPSDIDEHKALHGLTRSLVANMVHGCSQGFEKALELVGVGYRAQKAGRKLLLSVGYSQPKEIDPPAGIEFDVPNPSAVIVKGPDKEAVGQMAASVRKVRPPEVYKGKGIRYLGEAVRHKAGKAGK